MIIKSFYNSYYSIYYSCPYRIRRLLFSSHFSRVSTPYASHLPILIGLARIIKIRRVLELGSGLYSSVVFMNNLAFPALAELHSVENDANWAKVVSNKIFDSRFKYTILDGSIRSFLEQVNMDGYDLVFVDDSSKVTDRAQTIEVASKMLANDSLMVIHDYEIKQYRDSSKSIRNKYSFNLIYPNTGVLWNYSPIDLAKLGRLCKLVRKYKLAIPLEDADNWALLFNSKINAKTS